MIIEVTIEDLRKGHYVVDIAKQAGAFSLTRAAFIKSVPVIEQLKLKGVASVLIDTSKTLDETLNGPHGAEDNHSGPMILEVKQAQKLFNESKKIQHQVFQDAQHGRSVNLAPVVEVTNKTIDAIFKNPDALACVINIRNKNEYLLEHSVAVAVLMTMFARFLKIDKHITQQLAIGAFLHDVGKILIPDHILNKPGKLTDEEHDIMNSHVEHSIRIIKKTANIAPLSIEVAAQHHERADGSGYPLHLTREQISNYGFMIGICDVFDALTAARCYKDRYSHIKAFSILRSLADKNKLNQRLVDMFIKCLGVYPVGSLVELNSQRLAIVESRNQSDPINPKVRCFYDAEQHRYVMTQDIDLAKEDDYIVKGVRADDYNLDMNKVIEFLLMEG